MAKKPKWSHDTVFPIIARAISNLKGEEQGLPHRLRRLSPIRR